MVKCTITTLHPYGGHGCCATGEARRRHLYRRRSDVNFYIWYCIQNVRFVDDILLDLWERSVQYSISETKWLAWGEIGSLCKAVLVLFCIKDVIDL